MRLVDGAGRLVGHGIGTFVILPNVPATNATPRRKPDGIETRTLWGELAWQIGHAAGDAAGAYALVADKLLDKIAIAGVRLFGGDSHGKAPLMTLRSS